MDLYVKCKTIEILGNNRKINLWVLRPSEHLVLDFTIKTNLFFFLKLTIGMHQIKIFCFVKMTINRA